MRMLISATLALTPLAAPTSAQVVQGVSQTTPEGTTTTVFTISPQTGVSGTDYVKLSADALNYKIAAAALASTKAQRDDVKALARQTLEDGSTQQKSLDAALSNADRKITRPSETLSSERKANLDLLRKAPRSGFDNLYLSQQADAAPAIWALQKGYATDGTDTSLRQVAASAVPPIEREYATVRSLMPAGLAQSR
ncbi:DUF4142 domain-containing protein [Sphingomonas oryzagri]